MFHVKRFSENSNAKIQKILALIEGKILENLFERFGMKAGK